MGHRIRGRVIKTSDGDGLAGVIVVLSGTRSASTTTDAAGAYAFPDLAGGADHQVTPSKAGYVFTPTSYSAYRCPVIAHRR